MFKIKKLKTVICKDYLKRPMRVKVHDLEFRPSVYGIILRGPKILLAKTWDGYDFPGGGVELGETIDQALEREVWEETGLKVKRGAVVAAESSFFIGPMSGTRFHSILVYYLCKNVRGKISIKGFDEFEKKFAGKAEWVDLKKIKKIRFYNSINSFVVIRRALELRKVM